MSDIKIYPNQIKRNRKGHININATVKDAIRYAIARYKQFNAHDVMAVINNLLPEEEKLTLKQVQTRLSKEIQVDKTLQRTGSYYHVKGWPNVKS